MRGLTRCNSRLVIAAAMAILLVSAPLHSQPGLPSSPTRAIGIEGRVSLELPRGDYRPLPLDDRTELILRVESIRKTADGRHRYDFYYMGLEPGDYSLANYLVRPDGSRPDELGNTLVHVQAVLPEDHDGKLTDYARERFPFIGGYRIFLVLVAILWVGGLVGFAISYRKRRVVAAPVVAVTEPSFAERIRPLVEAAACGKLSLDDKAKLERLLMGFWREKLNLPELRMAESLERLKNHEQAGELLRSVERWLHHRSGAPDAEVNALLAPYRGWPATTAGGAE